MAMKSGTDARSRIGLLGAAAMTLMLSAAATRPALALEDDGRESIFSSLVSMVMPGDTNPESRIDYRERAPLVVPKNREALPAPQPKAAERTKAWPKNQETARKEAERARALAPRVDEVHNPVSRTELDRVRSAGVQGPGADASCNEPLGRPCNQEAFWASLKNSKSASDETKDLVPGKEASRKFLTDPPTGYRKPTTVQKYTFEVKKQDDITDSREQAILEKRRREER